MFNKKVLRESVAYLSLLAFAIQFLLIFILPEPAFGPVNEGLGLSGFCFGSFFILTFVFSGAIFLFLLDKSYHTYQWNIFGLISYTLFAVILFVAGQWTLVTLLLMLFYGPISILVEWFTKPGKETV